jgi:hypothetical protein
MPTVESIRRMVPRNQGVRAARTEAVKELPLTPEVDKPGGMSHTPDQAVPIPWDMSPDLSRRFFYSFSATRPGRSWNW